MRDKTEKDQFWMKYGEKENAEKHSVLDDDYDEFKLHHAYSNLLASPEYLRKEYFANEQDKHESWYDPYFHVNIATNPNTPSDVLDHIFKNGAESHQVAALEGNPNLSNKHLSLASASSFLGTRIIAAKHKKATKDSIFNSLMDSNEKVRNAARENPNAQEFLSSHISSLNESTYE